MENQLNAVESQTASTLFAFFSFTTTLANSSSYGTIDNYTIQTLAPLCASSILFSSEHLLEHFLIV
jgi:hypothetical protein